MSRTRYHILEKTGIHFLTCSVVRWLPALAPLTPKEMILDSLRFLQENARLDVYAYVIMETHFHLIASSADLPAELKNLKSFTARKILDYFQEHGNIHFLNQMAFMKPDHKQGKYQFWQEGSLPKLIRDREMMSQKIEYIHNNPVKRGYVDKPEHWRYSSARNYLGFPGLLPICTEW